MRLGLDTFRRAIRRQRLFVLAFLLLEIFTLVDGRNFVHAYQVHEEREERLREVSEILGIPVEQLRPEHDGLFDQLKDFLGETSDDPVKAAGRERLQQVLARQAEALASNPYFPQIEQVEREHRIHRVEGLLDDLRQLTKPGNGRGKALTEGSQRALLRGLHHGLGDGLRLPEPIEGLPAKALERHAALQSKLDRLAETTRPIVAASQDPEAPGTLAQKVEQLRLFENAGLERRQRAPRFAERPLPTRRVEREARSVEASTVRGEKVLLPRTAPREGGPEAIARAAKAIAPQIAALAEELGHSPAKMLTFVREQIAFDPKWGASKSPLGTLEEGLGTSWDQAWLLQELLMAAGVDARFEWGQVEITPEQLTNLVGIDDPWRAADLLTTAGNPVVLLTAGSQVQAVRMEHAWVRAHLDYIPDRGMKAGPGDTWIAMDPTLVSIDWSEGLRIHESVPFTLEGYLTSGTERSPRRFYEDALWSHIRAAGIQCSTLEQLKRSGTVEHETIPFVPGTLKAEIVRFDGQATTVPTAKQYALGITVRTTAGDPLLSWSSPWPAVYGQRLELAWPGATADDQATIAGYGSLFDTPPYLVELAPQVRLGNVTSATGNAIGAALDIEVEVTVSSPVAPARSSLFQLAAGEQAVFAFDLGHLPQSVVDRHRAEQGTAGSEAATLALLGAQYLHNLGRDLADLGGWKRQRVVQLGTLGMTVQTGRVGTTIGGSPLSFERDSLVVDIATMPLGLFSADGSSNPHAIASLELLGSQSSFLEGALFDQVVADEGISAVAFLTRAVREGQSLQRLDSSNAEAVLATVELGDEVEAAIRTGIGQGKIAWVPESELTVNQWRGAGYILEDPATGAAGYLATGGYGAGAATGKDLAEFEGLLGSESWLGDLFGGAFGWLFGLLGIGGSEEPTTIVSDPINLSNGNMIRRTTDFQVMARGLPIEWSRTYNSRSNRVGVFGHGWTFTYGETLEPQGDGAIVYREEDGTTHRFEPDGAGGWISPAGKHLELTADATGDQLRMKDGLVLRFAPIPGGDATVERLTSISDRNGNTLTLGYDAAAQLATITDAAGRQVLTLTHQAGKIVRVDDLVGRSVVYGYQGDDLVSVTDVAGETWQLAYDAGHNLVSVTDPLGNTDTFVYDSKDRCVQHVDPLGDVETFAYVRQGERAVMTDRRGFSSYLEMDEQGRATLKADPLGNVTRAEWDGANNRTATTDPRGGTTRKTWDAQGNLLSETDPLGQTTTYTYEPTFNNLTSRTDANGQVETLVYDAAGNMVERRQVVGGETLVETYVVDALGRMVEQRDTDGNATTFAYATDPALDTGIFTSQTDALGHTTHFAFDPAGRLESMTDPAGNVITATFDARGNPTSVSDWRGNTTTMEYDALGRSIAMDGPSGRRTIEYDAKGRALAQVDPLGQRTTSVYDAEGNVVTAIDAKGNRTEILYDALGRRSAVIDALGSVWSFGFCNELGQSTAGCSGGGCAGGNNQATFCDLTDPLGNTIKQEVDALGRVVRVEDPLGNASSMQYDALGRQVAMTDALGRSTAYEYDAIGRLTAVVEANGGRTEYAYDRRGNLVERMDAEGRLWRQEYDVLNRLTKEIDPLGFETSYAYDALGNLASRLDANGTLLQYQYQVNLLEAILDGDGNVLSQWTYDSLGRRQTAVNADVSLEYQYDTLSRPSAVINHTLAKTLDYTYDANGNREVMVGPKGPIEYFYDARNQLVEMRDPATGTYRFEYDALGRRTRLAYPNGVDTRYTYDAASRLLTLITSNSQGEILDGYAYTYDAYGNRVTMRNLRNEIDDTYQYDTLNRLIRWERGSDRFEAYTYDNVGNRTRLEDENGTVTYTYDDGDRLLTEVRTRTDGSVEETVYGWDAVGQMVSREKIDVSEYWWNDQGFLASVDSSAAHGPFALSYSPAGYRVKNRDNLGEARFEVDEFAKGGYPSTIALEDDRQGTSSYRALGAKVDEHLASAVESADQTVVQFHHADALGSIATSTDDSGRVIDTGEYSPFGVSEGGNGATVETGFTGRERATTGLLYFRSRFYSPMQGRFISRDSFPGNLRSPRSQNRYTYVENDPANFTDPSGHFKVAAGLVLFWFGLSNLLDIMAALRLRISKDSESWDRLQKEQDGNDWRPWASGPNFFETAANRIYHGTLLAAGALGVALYFYAWGYAGVKLLAYKASGADLAGKFRNTIDKFGVGLTGALSVQFMIVLGSCARQYVAINSGEGPLLYRLGDFTAYCLMFTTLFAELAFRAVKLR